MTNGEALKKLFPQIDTTEAKKTVHVLLNGVTIEDFELWVSKKWWNAPYKAESEGKE